MNDTFTRRFSGVGYRPEKLLAACAARKKKLGSLQCSLTLISETRRAQLGKRSRNTSWTALPCAYSS